MDRKIYQYDGGVRCFDQIVTTSYKAQTTAVSEKKAISNLVYRYKKEHGMAPSASIKLTGKPIAIS